jgi:hypothetical protein
MATPEKQQQGKYEKLNQGCYEGSPLTEKEQELSESETPAHRETPVND